MKTSMLRGGRLPSQFSGSAMVIAHRGGAGERPENTVVACEYALENGADGLELDVQMTRDGVPVVFHDAAPGRTTDGCLAPQIRGARHPSVVRVSDLSYEEIARLDAGYSFAAPGFPWRGCGVRVPSLEQLFARFPHVPIILDLKKQKNRQDSLLLVDRVGRLIAQHRRVQWTIVGSFSDHLLKQCRRQFPDILTGAGVLEVMYGYCLHRIGLGRYVNICAAGFQIPVRRGPVPVARASFLQAMVHRGYRMDVWTVNDSTQASVLFQNGATGVITDYPKKVSQIKNCPG